ncbi:PadR family transcriptional regulator [Streptomyces sp. NPDC002896]|uniref:PadR family transcriptional regulator n=1 Tax=Streptomyces sp. NPDC002896 TaxID=3154438 RepID=UPI00332FC373
MPNSKSDWTPSVLGNAILQLLTRNTMSGYDLKKRFHSSIGNGWHAYDTQIYRELKQLETHGFITGRVAPGVSGPQRRLYSISEKGLSSVTEWLTSSMDLDRIKDEVGLRTCTADLFPGESFEEFVHSVADQWEKSLQHQRISLQVLTEQYGGGPETSDDTVFGRQLAIEMMILTTEARLEWTRRALRVLRRRRRLAEASSESA